MIHHCLPFKRGNPTSAYRDVQMNQRERTRADTRRVVFVIVFRSPTPKYTHVSIFALAREKQHWGRTLLVGDFFFFFFAKDASPRERWTMVWSMVLRERVSASSSSSSAKAEWKTHRDSVELGDIAVSLCCSSSSRSKIPGNFQRCTCFEWRSRLPVWRSWNYPGRSRTGLPRWHYYYYCCRICSTPSPARIWSARVDDACNYGPRTWKTKRRVYQKFKLNVVQPRIFERRLEKRRREYQKSGLNSGRRNS